MQWYIHIFKAFIGLNISRFIVEILPSGHSFHAVTNTPMAYTYMLYFEGIAMIHEMTDFLSITTISVFCLALCLNRQQ